MPKVFTITKWATKDGREFNTEDEALGHERATTYALGLARILGGAFGRFNSDDYYSILATPNFRAVVEYFNAIVENENNVQD